MSVLLSATWAVATKPCGVLQEYMQAGIMYHATSGIQFLEEKNIYFLADIPHLLKNIRNCLLTKDVALPPDVLVKENLISPKVSIQHIAAVINHEEDNELKIAPVLSRHHVEPGQYQKMCVHSCSVAQSQHCLCAEVLCSEWYFRK